MWLNCSQTASFRLQFHYDSFANRLNLFRIDRLHFISKGAVDALQSQKKWHYVFRLQKNMQIFPPGRASGGLRRRQGRLQTKFGENRPMGSPRTHERTARIGLYARPSDITT